MLPEWPSHVTCQGKQSHSLSGLLGLCLNGAHQTQGRQEDLLQPYLFLWLLDLLLSDLLTDGCFLHTEDVGTPLGQLFQAALNIQT